MKTVSGSQTLSPKKEENKSRKEKLETHHKESQLKDKKKGREVTRTLGIGRERG
jgi:hypothetical protein